MLSDAIGWGPLLVPLMLLLVVASAGSALAIGKWLSRSSAAVDNALWHALLAGVAVARLAFVYEYPSLYLAAPWTVLDIRDGGWNPTAGLMGAWLFALYRGRRLPAIAKPLRAALAVGTAVFFIGTLVLALQGPSGRKLPDLAFDSIDGTTVRLRDFEGRPMVVNLWATWCGPCVREMPVLQEAQAGHPDVVFVFLNQGEDPARVARWLVGQQLALRNVLLDPKRQASAAFTQKGYPTTLFFNAGGELVASRIGELSAATLREKLDILR